MKTVYNNEVETIINKSRFIALTFFIENIEEVKNILELCNKNFKDFNHCCYAYILSNNEKAEDDGEPVGTAGIPILNVLKKENLDNALCVVIRYFGGIKLGAGGLIRAYSKACKNGLKIIELNEGYIISLSFDYNNIKEMDYLLKDCMIVNKNFDLKTTYEVKIDKNYYDKISNQLKNISDVIIIKNTYL